MISEPSAPHKLQTTQNALLDWHIEHYYSPVWNMTEIITLLESIILYEQKERDLRDGRGL